RCPPDLRREDRRLYPSAIPAILHDVVRQLPGGDGPPRTPCRQPLQVNCRMNKTIFTIKERPTVPLETEVFSPDVIAPLKHDQVRALPVFLGKRQYRMEDFFTIEGAGSDDLEVRGDAGRVKWIGRGMTHGRISIIGDGGMHLGAYLKGGTIE